MIDVIVLGGGIVGASAARTLAHKGQRVALVERDFCGSHSSGVNYGGVRRQGRPVHQLPLSQRAHQLWADLPGLIGIDGEYVRCGHLKLARSQADFAALQAYAEQTRDFDLGLQLLDYAQLRARFPGWAMWRSARHCALKTAMPTRAWSRPPSPVQRSASAPRCTSRPK